jgi:peptide/nickel transport system permease protein
MLPAATLGFSVMAPVARMVRSTMLEILESDYVKARGPRACRGAP